jgi:hypothetical protein
MGASTDATATGRCVLPASNAGPWRISSHGLVPASSREHLFKQHLPSSRFITQARGRKAGTLIAPRKPQTDGSMDYSGTGGL